MTAHPRRLLERTFAASFCGHALDLRFSACFANHDLETNERVNANVERLLPLKPELIRFTKIASVCWLVTGFALPPVIANTSATANNNLGPAKTSVFVAKKGAAKGRSKTKHRAARKSQGPAREERFEEVFPPGHTVTPDENAQASTLGTYFANAMWKD